MSDLPGHHLFGHDLQDEVAVSRWAFALPALERDRLVLATASVLAAEDLRARPRARALLDALLPALAANAEPSTRREAAHRLSEAPWAPEALLLDLAFDPELKVQPVVVRALALPEAALLRMASEGEPATLDALARRPGELPPAVQALLADRALHRPDLRAPLARRADLTPEVAARLHAVAGPDVARDLAARFDLPPAQGGAGTPEADRRLVDKLQRAGRLTPGYAVNALRRGRPGLFGQAVARLADLAPETVDVALRDETPADLALACAAASVDRAVFPIVLASARAVQGLPSGAGEDSALPPEVSAAFDRAPADAARALRTAAGRRASRWDMSRAPA